MILKHTWPWVIYPFTLALALPATYGRLPAHTHFLGVLLGDVHRQDTLSHMYNLMALASSHPVARVSVLSSSSHVLLQQLRPLCGWKDVSQPLPTVCRKGDRQVCLLLQGTILRLLWGPQVSENPLLWNWGINQLLFL